MFLGHYAVAYAAKKAAPKANLGLLFMSVVFLDLLWPIFLLLGIEQVRIHPGDTDFTPLDFVSYPWSHSLVMSLFWSLLVGVIAFLVIKDRRVSVVAGLCVFSHWVLDWASHRPDMPILPGGSRYGLGLWNSVSGTILVELLMFALGLGLYLSITRAKGRAGLWTLWGFNALMLFFYLSAAFGPPPPNVQVLAYGALAAWLFPLWGMWIERNRNVLT